MSPQPAQATWPAEPTDNPGTKPNAAQPLPNHPNPDAIEHAQIGTADKQEGGKDMGLVKAPIVSMHPTSEPQGDANAKVGEHRIIDNANIRLNHYMHESAYVELKYPFEDLEIGQGMFIPVEQNSTTDKAYV